MADSAAPAAARSPRRQRRAALWALGLCLLAAGLLAWAPPPVTRWQEAAFDLVIRLSPPGPSQLVRVVDIGRTDDTGQRWSRASSARLAARLADSGALVVGWDIVFAGGCGPEPANLALAAALARGPNVLGFLLSANPVEVPGPRPALAISDTAAARLWAAPGAEGPCPGFLGSPVTLGAISLPGDDSARVRAVPAAVRPGGQAWPSLPVEVWRRTQDLGAPVILEPPGGGGAVLRLGPRVLALDPAGMLRFRPSPPDVRQARTLPATAVLEGATDDLRGRVVLVGSSLPQSGGLRPTSLDPLYPSVQIAADLIEGFAVGPLPSRAEQARWVEGAGLALAGLLLAAALALAPPAAALALALILATVWATGAFALHRATGWLIDPALPPLALVAAAFGALSVQAALATRAERALRQRMGQILPPAVVARLAAAPDLLRLKGEQREITALFTDLEGFSTTAAGLPPEALIALLDRYFTAINAVILRHGGMVDKIVGDAVHAFFNAPLDQPEPVESALSAAAEILEVTERLRAELPALGRTRIGIETGPAILGDVGAGGRIDYTAHGACVNLAARLQEAGKTLGPAIIIGPGASARARRPLTALGTHALRSFGPLALSTLPVPPGTAGTGTAP